MKKQFLLLATTMLAFNMWAQEFNGAGTADSPYFINNKEDLARLAVLVNEGNTDYRSAAYRLTADIDLADFGADATGWLPIGNNDYPFQGQFDGDNHTIYNLTIKGTDITYAGLFGRVTFDDSELKNIKFVGGEIQVEDTYYAYSYPRVGFLAGYFEGKEIDNCSSTGTISISLSTTGGSESGGLVGYIAASISNCYATGDVTVSASSPNSSFYSAYAGGLIGHASTNSTSFYYSISSCYATGNVTTSNIYSDFGTFGGLVGYVSGNSLYPYSYSISDCCATGDISVPNTSTVAGGLIGEVESYNPSFIDNCHATGKVTASSHAGGFIGRVNSGSVSINNCYATGDAAARSSAGGLVGYADSSSSSINDCYATGDATARFAGGLVGITYSAINNCYAMGNVTASGEGWSDVESYAGGLVGVTNGEHSSISNSYATGDVTALAHANYSPVLSYAGGLVGRTSYNINKCYATGTVTASADSDYDYDDSSYSYAGGLVGYADCFFHYSFISISDCYATGNATSSSDVSHAGGLVGYVTIRGYDSYVSITNSYAVGSVSAFSSSTSYYGRPSAAGGLVGYISSGSIISSVSANDFIRGESITETLHMGSIAGYSSKVTIANFTDCYYRETMVVVGTGTDNTVSGQAATASDLTNRDFYVNLGWDMDNIWSIEEGIDLPKLRAIPEQPTSINTPSIASQENNVRVYYDGNSIVVIAANAGETVWVYNLSGTLVQTQSITSSQTTIALPEGVYIVKVGEARFKVISGK